jgi:hypothetical protein
MSERPQCEADISDPGLVAYRRSVGQSTRCNNRAVWRIQDDDDQRRVCTHHAAQWAVGFAVRGFVLIDLDAESTAVSARESGVESRNAWTLRNTAAAKEQE